MLRPCVVVMAVTLWLTLAAAGWPQQPTRAGSSYSGPPADPAAWPVPTHFIAPDGSDQNAGTSPQAPWRTFAHAIAQLQPGDVLGVMDGVYEPETTGLIRVDCEGGAARGTAEAPITVRAVHERQAVLKSDGLVTAIDAQRAQYWDFLGLVAVGADKRAEQGNYHLIGIDYCHFVSVKRCVAAWANRTGWNANNQLHSVRYSTDVTVEECEYYGHHRHALSVWKSHNCTARRNYINPRHHRGPGERGDEAIVFYQSSWCIAENNISEGLNLGFQAHGGVTWDGLPGGSYNQFLGNISIDAWNATRTDSRLRPHTEIKPATGNVFRDFLVVRPQRFGIWLSSTTDTLVENATIYAGASDGFVADERGDGPYDQVPGGCSFTLRNSLIIGCAGAGVRTTYPQWLVEHCVVTGNRGGDFVTGGAGEVRDALDLAPAGMGLGPGECIVYVPESSPLKGAGIGGADIGANVIYRYIDGELTDEPLWDPHTGQFPHGALVAGISDIAGDSLFDVHTRLNVNCNGCPLPYAQ
ncbi:MAG: right-handed parallel beta-helix repeat-containing protein [Armatimonadota bacterium]